MSNPTHILEVLDHHLTRPAEIILFGRAALALGFRDAPANQDLDDIRFLLEQEPVSPDELRQAFARARVPDVPEIRDLFVAAQSKVLELARITTHKS